MSIWNVTADYMHCKHLGSDKYFLGSILLLLIDTGMPSNGRMVNMANLLVEFKAYWRTHLDADARKNCYSGLVVSKFRKPGQQPKLKAMATEIKHLGPALQHVWTQRSCCFLSSLNALNALFVVFSCFAPVSQLSLRIQTCVFPVFVFEVCVFVISGLGTSSF